MSVGVEEQSSTATRQQLNTHDDNNIHVAKEKTKTSKDKNYQDSGADSKLIRGLKTVEGSSIDISET